MDIKSLPPDVRRHLRSGININSVCQCVMELVLNSLDAKSTAVAVRINLLKFKIQVVDNGRGITKSNMHLVGIRYMTSKCQSLTDLKKLRHFGFRGEALASIRGISEKLLITSRAQNTEITCSKTHENGKWSTVEAVKQRPSQGTTVTIEGFMHNLPVRQKRIKESIDLNETKRVLESLAIIHPNVSFSLRNDVSGKIIMQSKQTQTVSQALVNLHPDMSVEDLMEIKVHKCKTSISGLIYKKPHPGPKLQLVYLNKRPINSPKIQKLANSLLLKSCIFQKSPQVLRHLVISGPPEKDEHPAYVLHIRCPYSEIDLTMSPAKTTVEFKQWDVVLTCITKAIAELLKDKQLIDPTFASAKKIKKSQLASSNGVQSQFGVSQIRGAVTSVPFKRKPTEEIVELPEKLVKYASDANNEDIISSDKQYGNEDIGKEPLASENVNFGLGSETADNMALNDKNAQTKEMRTYNKQEKHKNLVERNGILIGTAKNNVFTTISGNSKNEKNTNQVKKLKMKSCMKKSQRKNLSKFNNNDLNQDSNLQNMVSNHSMFTDLVFSKNGDMNHINNNHPQNNNEKYKFQKKRALEVNETYKHNVDDQNKNNQMLPLTIFDKHANTQSLVLNSDAGSLPLGDNPLLNSTTNTNTLNNQDNGKNLIMDMFLKSTLIYPNKSSEITDSNTIKTVVVKTTKENLVTECRNQNTTINMSVMVSKRTVVTNSMYILQSMDENRRNNRQTNLERRLATKSIQHSKYNPNINEKLISKSIQRTMVEQQKELNLNFDCTNEPDSETTSEFHLSNFIPHDYNVTFSKYFRKSHRKKRLQILPKHKPLSNELPSLYDLNDHPFDINVETCRPEMPRFFNNQEQSRPIVHFGSLNSNGGKIPRFGSTDYFLKPTILASNNGYSNKNHNFDNFTLYNLYHADKFRRPIQRYDSDYNFKFSNLNVSGEPYKQFLEEQDKFLNPQNRFEPFKMSNFQRRLQNIRHDDKAVENCLNVDSCNITVPLYQRYTTRNEELNNFVFDNRQPRYEHNNLNFHNNRNSDINNVETINSMLVFNRVTETPKCLLPLKNNSENKNNYGIQRQNTNIASNHEKLTAMIPHPIQYTKKNPFFIFTKSHKNTDTLNVDLEEQRRSPFFRQSSKRNQSQIINQHWHQKRSYHHRNIKRNHLRNVPTRAHQNVSPFFREATNNSASETNNKRNFSRFFKASSNAMSSLIPQNQYFGSLIPHVASHKIEMKSPFFRAEKRTPLHAPLNMEAVVNKILVNDQTNNHHIGKYWSSSKQNNQHPRQNLCENSNNVLFQGNFLNEQQQQDAVVKNHMNNDCLEKFYVSPTHNKQYVRETFCENSNDVNVQGTFLNYEQQQRDVSVKAATNNDHLKQSCFSLSHKKPQMRQNLCKNSNQDILFNYDLHQHSCLLPPREQVPHERRNQDTNLPITTEFSTKPLHNNRNEINQFFHTSIANLKAQKQNFHIRKSKLSLKRYPTEPSHSNIVENYQKSPITRSNNSSFNFLKSECQLHENFISEGNIEYNVKTPNINMSSTEAIQHIELDPTDLLDSSLCSINFKPALCSTRLNLFDQNPAGVNLSPSRLKLGTDVVSVTPTNFQSCPVPSFIPPPHNPELNKRGSKTKQCKPFSNVCIPMKHSSAEDVQMELMGRGQNDLDKSPWSLLKIPVSRTKKTKLIETELVKDCQLNKKSDSGGSEYLHADSVNYDNCNLEKLECGSGKVVNSNNAVDVQTSLEKEWIKKINKFGSIFYINKRTGMTSMYSPRQDTSFKFVKRFEFVPKGLSPIFVETKKVDVSLSPTSKKFLHEAILKSYEDELNIVKWENYINDCNDVNKFFEELYKEKTKQLQYIVPNMIANDLPRFMIKLHKQVQAQSFTKDIFPGLEVLGQLDNKFIVTLIKEKKLILLFDQHAVHERVRLEKLLQDYKEQDGEDHKIKFKSTKCQEPIILNMLEEDLNIVEKYRHTFKDLGLSYERVTNQIEVTHIPTCIYNKFIKSKQNTGDTSLRNLVTSLIYEQITMITSTQSVKSRMPTVLQHIINSEACRGAIKFGEKLAHAECVAHLKNLSECTLPFQCAHGRPTLAPVLSLNHDFPTEKIKPNLRKLKNLKIDTQ